MKIIKIMILLTLTTGLLACTVPHSGTASDKAQPNAQEVSAMPKIGLQLWSIKDNVKQDFKGTLTQVANMGFKGVEFAGDYGPFTGDGKRLKAFLNSLGLTASAAHIRFKDFNEANFSQSVAFFRDAGINTLIVPWDDRAWDKNKIQALVTDLNQLAAKLTREGFHFGYHNHDEEFNRYGNATFWDHIARATSKEFVLQMDVGWVTYAEHNPLTYIKRYPGRTLTTHFKAKLPKSAQGLAGKRAIIGDDITDWASVIKTDISHGGTEWFIVEQEEYPDGLTPLEAVKLSKQGLDNIIASLKL
ncbi:sugar phosphate isomerase/epimerase [Thalassomonas viridans]|uniref:Sugar phosphate isomerase/epimerase n=1 Tax=Thalassomonas viridans TaxID=137584 RepID=A0AAE9YZU6_9GAMM|nr:sugar phosphate isomerase/epimerase [Thalassomonas viridans]WDE03622.1 sugar phosphate isomerase/epimerase [Thalassomonas viridans]